MEREKITILAQLFTAVKEGAEKLGKALEKGDAEELSVAKTAILNLQSEINKIL